VQDNLIISYLTLRKVIGWLGMGLGIFCFVGGLVFAGIVKDSISAYYHSNMRDVMVGVLMIAGAFLVSYKGYDKLDDVMSNVAGISAIVVGLFPCYSGQTRLGFMLLPGKFVGVVHFVSAGVFFLTLAFISYFLFTKSGEKVTYRKRQRNKVYRVCGIVIFVSVLVLALAGLFVPSEITKALLLTLVVEIVMLIAFGISWLVKGEVLLGDL